MAITISELTSAYDPTDATSYTTASVSPAANSLLVVFWATRENTAAPSITVSGGGLTWTETEPEQVDGISAIGSWRAQCGASPGSFTIGLSCDGGITAIGAAWSVLQVAGHDSASPIVQSPIAGTGSTGTTATVTFAALAGSSNAQLLHAIHRSNEAQSAEAGWTAGTARNGTGPNFSSLATWRIASADLSATQTWSTSARWQAQGLEIQASGGSVTGTGSATLAGVSSSGQGAPAPEAVYPWGVGGVGFGSPSHVPPWPTGYTPVADDLGILSVHQDGSNSAITITGSTWTLIKRTQRTTDHVHALYRRKLTGSSDQPTVNFAAASSAQSFLSVWRNVDTGTAEDATAVSNTGTVDTGHTGPDIGPLTTPAAAIVTWCVLNGCPDSQGIFVDDDPTIGGPFRALEGTEIAGSGVGRLLGTACAYHHQSIPSQTELTRIHSFSPPDVIGGTGTGWIATTIALRPANPTITPVPYSFQGAIVQVPLQTVGTECAAADPLNTTVAIQAFDPVGAGGDLWSSGGADGGFWDLGAWGGPGRWRDITSRTRGVKWTVGADQPGGRPRAGTADIELDNSDALVSPWVTAGPFTDGASSWLRTGALLRIAYTATNVAGTVGYGRSIFTGEIESVDEGSTATADAWVVLHLVEPISRLARWNGLEQGQQGLHENLYSRFNRLLDDAAWPFGWGLNSTGTVPAHATAATLQATTMAGERLGELYLTADSTGVNIYSSGDGSLLVNNPRDVAATNVFSNVPAGAELPLVSVVPYANNSRIINAAIGSRRTSLPTATDPDPLQPTAIQIGDGPSQSRFGRIDTGNGWPRLDLICESDDTVAAILNAVLAFRADDDQGIAGLEVDADQAPTLLFGYLAGLRLFDVLDVRYVHPLVESFSQTQHSYLEGAQHRITRLGYQMKWTASLSLGKFP